MNDVKLDQPRSGEHSGQRDKLGSQDQEFTLAHLSDPHLTSLGSVRVRDLLNKRLYGYLSWRLRRSAEHRGEVLAALLEDLGCTRPDHMAVTGDLTHLGLPHEFREARAFLRTLGPPANVTVIPGNHDVYVDTPWDRTFELWRDYMTPDEDQRHSPMTGNSSLFPFVRVRGPLAVIAVSSARPTLPFLAVGSIGLRQRERLETILAETGRRGLLRVVLIHHPPVSGIVSWRKRLTDQTAFRSIVGRHGAELILHGHTHRIFSQYLETPWGKIFCAGVSSASSIGRSRRRRARYHLFRFIHDAEELKVSLSVRVYAPSERRFVEENLQGVSLPQGFSDD